MTVEEFEHQAVWGPISARIRVQADLATLWMLVDWLGSGLNIYARRARPCWWGIYHTLELDTGFMRHVFSLEQVRNKVAVQYSLAAPGLTTSSSATTTWASNAGSQADFGIREFLASKEAMSASAAEQLRDTLLSDLAYPVDDPRQGGGGGTPSAMLYGKGYHDHLGRRYCSLAAVGESHIVDDLATSEHQKVGDVTARTGMAQSFTMATDDDFYAATIRLPLSIYGAPGDTLQASIRADSGGAPGATIEAVTFSPAAMTTHTVWLEAALACTNLLEYGTTYHLSLERTGAIDASNYYIVGASEALGYSRGSLLIWNGGAWVARSPDADMPFVIGGVQDSTRQIEKMVSGYGQYFAGTRIGAVSGVKSSPYRIGTGRASDEIIDLLTNGTTNDRRLLAHVTRQKYLAIAEAPAFSAGTCKLLLNEKGRLVNRRTKEDIPPEECPAGKWCLLGDYPQGLINSPAIGKGRIFIERATWNVAEERWMVERGDPFKALDVREG
jgi:hypothetical protein